MCFPGLFAHNLVFQFDSMTNSLVKLTDLSSNSRKKSHLNLYIYMLHEFKVTSIPLLVGPKSKSGFFIEHTIRVIFNNIDSMRNYYVLDKDNSLLQGTTLIIASCYWAVLLYHLRSTHFIVIHSPHPRRPRSRVRRLKIFVFFFQNFLLNHAMLLRNLLIFCICACVERVPMK